MAMLKAAGLSWQRAAHDAIVEGADLQAAFDERPLVLSTGRSGGRQARTIICEAMFIETGSEHFCRVPVGHLTRLEDSYSGRGELIWV